MVAKKCHCRQMPKVIWRRREELQSFSLFNLKPASPDGFELGFECRFMCNNLWKESFSWAFGWASFGNSVNSSCTNSAVVKQRPGSSGGGEGGWDEDVGSVSFSFPSWSCLMFVVCVDLMCFYFVDILRMHCRWRVGGSEHWLRGWIGASGDKFSN